jgi:hypothetical protein
MSNTNTGGPAFPFPAFAYQNGEINSGEGGMTLRDYFAAKAMAAYASSADWRIDMGPDETAFAAYKQADAMLEARNK